jgi:hypothetical protein
MVCVTGSGADVDNDWEQERLEATVREMLENGDESPPSSARCVRREGLPTTRIDFAISYFLIELLVI